MSYFTIQDHQAIFSFQAASIQGVESFQHVYDRLQGLHKKLYPQLKQHHINLHPNPRTLAGVWRGSNTTHMEVDALTLSYMRNAEQAIAIEHLMGRDKITQNHQILTQNHPAIEIRITLDHLAVELVIPPSARQDQENIAGKLTINQHRNDFYKLIKQIGKRYILGFWNGIYQQEDLSFDTTQLPPRHIFFEFFDTFSAGRDWFRLGAWYEPEAPELEEDQITTMIFNHIRALYPIYNFLAWTSDNNFVSLYKKSRERS